ncbi:class I SAM-dependent methyltransferase [Marmoricola sp. RAF53]|uniref:class I SAM-dependent methyltransferase n=1 Tax=Marmoricola sp. RAF53 TaxID=3233059 RepID=UPI003F9C8953
MDEDEIRRSAALEDRHWWYAARRSLVRSQLKGLPPGRALDVGCGSGGNSAAVRDLGWDVVALDLSPASLEAARRRGLDVLPGDARELPFPDDSFDLVLSTDAWEHVVEDDQVAREARRVLRRGGRLLVTVPAGMDLWSGHDLALGHHRRYERPELIELVERAGFQVEAAFGWNVLLRPIARMRRRHRQGCASEMAPVHPAINAALRLVLWLESFLPVRSSRGISMVLVATKP